MTMLCGFVSDEPKGVRERLLDRMIAALLDGRLTATKWHVDGLSIAVLDGASPGPSIPFSSSSDGINLWMSGELFSDYPPNTSELLRMCSKYESSRLSHLDGEYQIAVWRSTQRELLLWNDRFGGLPLYIATTPARFAFAGGVRGLLALPDVARDPDVEAIREAVSFGGYRLRGRTNIKQVTMLAGGSVSRWSADSSSLSQRRYWTWSDIPPVSEMRSGALLDRASFLWKRAIERRLRGAHAPGQTLSGGLDSRVILAEATRQVANWTGITYGLPGCDDARYAFEASRRTRSTWVFMPLYQDAWLEKRTRAIQATDGLIDLHDLGHLESLDLQERLIDVHLSGYIGDAVAGPTFADVETVDDVLGKLPYYGGTLGFSVEDARARAESLVNDLGGAPPRYAVFENKLPQSTNRWTAAWRPWIKVRKPFVDYEFFDFWQGLAVTLRRDHLFYERWLATEYPLFFGTIPNQRTGVPILSSKIRWQTTRAFRFGRRVLRPHLLRFGLFGDDRIRAYTDDEHYWRTNDAQRVIESTVLRADSISCAAFGYQNVKNVLDRWFLDGGVPAQVVGALYSYESYHRDLPPPMST